MSKINHQVELEIENRELKAEIVECLRMKEEMNKLLHAVEQSPSTVMITDVNGNIEYVNPKFTQLTGYTSEEVLGKNPRILKPSCKSSEEYRELWETITSGREWRGEFYNRKKNGEFYWENASISPVRNSQGVITHFIAVKEDITEHKRIEDELRKLSLAIEQSSSTVVITNNWGIIEYVNPKFTQLTGYRPEEVIGKNPRILKPDNISSDEFHHMWETISSGKEWRGEFCNKKKNGELYWEYASISPVRNTKGVITHFIAVKEDITERKKAEEERNKHIHELEDLMSFSAITNEAMQDEALFKHLSSALQDHFAPDVIAAVMIDRERNMLYVPLTEPPIPAQELIKNEAVFDPSLCDTLKTGRIQVVNDIYEKPPCSCIGYKIKEGGYICLPLIAGSITFGMVILFRKDMSCWNDDKIRRLMTNYVGVTALSLHRLELLDIAKHTNVTDELTGVYNHRFFNEILSKQLSLAKRRNEHVSLFIVEVDNFRRIQDTCGNDVGNRLLQQIAGILNDFLRDAGIIARYGNEEFAIIMPALYKTRALVKADDLRRMIESADFDTNIGGEVMKITVGIGVASFPDQVKDQETLIKYANKALYRAREEGGNRISAM